MDIFYASLSMTVDELYGPTRIQLLSLVIEEKCESVQTGTTKQPAIALEDMVRGKNKTTFILTLKDSSAVCHSGLKRLCVSKSQTVYINVKMCFGPVTYEHLALKQSQSLTLFPGGVYY